MEDVKELIEKPGSACSSADKQSINQDAGHMEPKSILIVEDDLIIAEVLNRTLHSLGYRVTGIVATGDRAIEMVSETIPDLILMEINLKKGEPSNIETAQRILTLFSIPIIYLTAYDDPSMVQQTMETLAYGYLRKPIDQRDLQIAIEIALVKHEKDMQLKSAHLEKEQYFTRFTAEMEALKRTLAESERRYHEIFDRSPDGIIVYDADGIIIEANEVMAKRLEIPPIELTGRCLAEFVPSDNDSAIRTHTATLLNGQPQVFDTTYVSESGKMTPAEVHEHNIPWNGGQAIISISRNITQRKQVEEELNLKNFILESSIDGIAIADLSGALTYVNPAFLSMWGYEDPKEVLGRLIGSFWQTPADMQQVMDEIRVHGKWLGEMTGKRKDGIPIQVQFSANVIRDGTGTAVGMMGSFLDITPQKQVEEALRESEKKFRSLVEFALEGILITDLQGTILFANKGLAHTIEVDDCAGLLGRNLLEFIAPESGEDVVRDFLQVSRGQDAYIAQYHAISAKGKEFFVESIGKVIEYEGKPADLIYIRDITKRKNAEAALQLSEARYRNIIKDQTEFICRFFPDGRLTFVNEAYCTFFGLNRDECIGKRHPVSVPPGDSQQIKNHLAALTPENPVNFITHRICMPSGEVRWHRWSDRAIFDTKGAVIEYQSVGRDITDQKAIETDLKNSRESLDKLVEARTADLIRITKQLRMEIHERKLIEAKLIIASNDKDLLLREIHHRVKNNLQLVSSLLDLTKMRTRDADLNTTLTEVMLKIQTMALIHTRLYESKRFDMVDMNRQIQDQMVSLSSIYSNKNRKVTNELHCSGIYLPVDQAIPCALIFNEILSNSYKHAFRGHTQGAVFVSVQKRKDHLRFIIRDDGIGIPKGFDINLANRLGLKLVRTLVQQQLKGSLTFHSDKGTEVIVEFPMKPQERGNG
jgi:PAS domain S-box-containing protein